MWYKTFLPQLHDVLKPSAYVEIGIRHGYSLSLSPQAEKIAIDPGYGESDMHFDVRNASFFRVTSDDFFKNHDLGTLLPGGYDLAYIDGMHLFEYALRDLINLERYAKREAVIIIDDVIPRDEKEAARTASGGSWTGDVWKLVDCLHDYRPELFATSLLARSEPTGCLILTDPCAANTVLRDHYDEILARYLAPGYPLMPGPLFASHGVAAEVALQRLATARA